MRSEAIQKAIRTLAKVVVENTIEFVEERDQSNGRRTARESDGYVFDQAVNWCENTDFQEQLEGEIHNWCEWLLPSNTKKLKGWKHFLEYVKNYLDWSTLDAPNAQGMINGWKNFVKANGRKKALEAFREWNNTLPPGLRSDCDPDGN